MPIDPLLAQLRLKLDFAVVREVDPTPQGVVYHSNGISHRLTVTLLAGDEVIDSTHLDIPGAIYSQRIPGDLGY